MSFLGKLFGAGAGAAANGIVDAAGKAADIVERWAPSAEKKVELQQEIAKGIDDSVAQARAYDPRAGVSTWFDSAVDGLNRLVRPVVAFTLMGAIFGWWHVAPPANLDPRIYAFGEAVIAFYFGVRTIIRDIPAGIAAIKNAVRSS